MEKVTIYTALVLVGLCFGSFAGAMVWRLRARQLRDDKASGEEYSEAEYERLEKLTKGKLTNDRSKCLHCPYELKWYDLLPVVSWLALGGKCRKCRKSIGRMEPLIELGVMAFFVLSYAFWPYYLGNALDVARLVVWLAAGVGLAILFVYDCKWYLLPDVVSFYVIGLGAINVVLVAVGPADLTSTLTDVSLSVAILSGIYYALYVLSRGKWVGFGDIKLGLGLALLLADWKLAFVALFAANLIGCAYVIPGMLTGKLKRDSHVPFGPMLVLGFVVAQLAGTYLVSAYLGSLLLF